MKAKPELHGGNRLLQVAEGLQILAKYCSNFDIDAQDGIISAGTTVDEDRDPDTDPKDPRLTEEEQKRMDALGWFVDSETDSWSFFA